MMGDAGVGKTALVSQFMTSEYMHTYDASLGKLKGNIFMNAIFKFFYIQYIIILYNSKFMFKILGGWLLYI